MAESQLVGRIGLNGYSAAHQERSVLLGSLLSTKVGRKSDEFGAKEGLHQATKKTHRPE
jgi:hypothetical protein